MDAVTALLERQGGVARRRDLLRAGLSRRQLQRRLDSGELRALAPRLFTDRDQPRPDDDLRAAAVELDAVVSHTSAALLWGLELVEAPQAVTVVVDRTRTRLVRPGVVVRRAALGPGDVVQRDGLRVTTVLRTVLDLCRALPLAQAVAVLDSALRRGLLRLEDVRAAHYRLPAAPGRAAVGRAVGLADPACGSVLESLVRVLLAQHGLRPPVSQHEVRTATGGLVGRVDFAWPHLRIVLEADGFAFHSDRRRYRDDRRRGNALVVAGWRLVRFSWEDVVVHPEYVVATVRALVERTAVHRTAA